MSIATTHEIEASVRDPGLDMLAQIERIAELKSRLPVQVSVLSYLLNRQAEDILYGSDLSLLDYRLLTIVETFGDISLLEIDRFSKLGMETIYAGVVDLPKRECLASTSLSHYRKSHIVRITATGREALARVKGSFRVRRARLSAAASEAEMQLFVRVLNRIVDWLEDDFARRQAFVEDPHSGTTGLGGPLRTAGDPVPPLRLRRADRPAQP